MPLVLRSCDGPNCANFFLARAADVNRGYGKFCSRTCSARNPRPALRRQIELTCAFCDVVFLRSRSRAAKSKTGLHFCCRLHKDLGQRLENGLHEMHPPHYGTLAQDYRIILER